MKVILQQDVAKIGRKQAVVDVPNGYALNKLIPTGKAIPATKQNLTAAAAVSAHQQAEEQGAVERFEQLREQLRDQQIRVSMNANDSGQLFQALDAKRVAVEAQGQGIDVPEAMIVIDTTIKSVGVHEIKLVSGRDTATFSVEIVAAT